MGVCQKNNIQIDDILKVKEKCTPKNGLCNAFIYYTLIENKLYPIKGLCRLVLKEKNIDEKFSTDKDLKDFFKEKNFKIVDFINDLKENKINFEKWLTNKEYPEKGLLKKLDKNTIQQYLQELENKIPEKLKQRDEFCDNLFKCKDVEYLEILKKRFLKGGDLYTNIYTPSAAIENYVMFLIEDRNKKNIKISLNQILYGPPGTGKTYSVIERAIEIIDGVKPSSRKEAKEKFKKYQKEGQIEFVTFHQSYSYEEFVEGIKPCDLDDCDSEKGIIKYHIENGIFKELCKRANEKKEVSNYDEKYEDLLNEIRTGKDEFRTKTGNIFKLKINSKNNLNVLTGENFNHNATLTKDILEQVLLSERPPYYESYYLSIAEYLKNLGVNVTQKEIKNYILIIDEINRGNISKIFGELITLIEEDKRLGNPEEMVVKLPYSKDDFGVPKNLYIIGTMNTADRSIALMDTALRRRFEFVEMMPQYDKLKEIGGIDLSKMLKKINERIEYLYDRDHTIGHAYFIKINTFDELKEVFKNKIIPLLQEYFYNDWERIRLVLGDNQVSEKYQFIKEKEFNNLFGDYELDEEKKLFEINEKAFDEKESYIKIYEKITDEENQ